MKKSILELTYNEVIHAPTLEIAEKLCKKFHELGLVWLSGNSYLKRNKEFGSYVYYRPKVGTFVDNKHTNYTKLSISDLSDFDEPIAQPQPHYTNELKQFRSLFELQEVLGLNGYEFDILKRLVRCRKKGQFKEDLKKIKDTCDLYLQESE